MIKSPTNPVLVIANEELDPAFRSLARRNDFGGFDYLFDHPHPVVRSVSDDGTITIHTFKGYGQTGSVTFTNAPANENLVGLVLASLLDEAHIDGTVDFLEDA